MQELTMKECELTPDECFDYYLEFNEHGKSVDKFKLDLFIEHLNLDIQKVA